METYLIELPVIVSVAFEVLTGKYGINEERKENIEALGLNYNRVQSCVNELVKLLEKYGD